MGNFFRFNRDNSQSINSILNAGDIIDNCSYASILMYHQHPWDNYNLSINDKIGNSLNCIYEEREKLLQKDIIIETPWVSENDSYNFGIRISNLKDASILFCSPIIRFVADEAIIEIFIDRKVTFSYASGINFCYGNFEELLKNKDDEYIIHFLKNISKEFIRIRRQESPNR